MNVRILPAGPEARGGTAPEPAFEPGAAHASPGMAMERRTKDAWPRTPPLWWAPAELEVEYERLLVEGEDDRADDLHELIASGYEAPDTGG